MTEFARYVSSQGRDRVSWSDLSADLSGKFSEAIGTRRRERAAFADQRMKNEEMINSYELGQNQSMNNLIMDGANQGREVLSVWNKQANQGNMTRSEHTKRQQTLSSYWGSLANAAKTFDERTQKTLERQNADDSGYTPGSSFELYVNQKFSELGNLKNRGVIINPESGTVYLGQYDDDGNLIDQLDVRQMNNPGNMLDNRVNLDVAVENGTKGWEDFTTFTEGPRGSSMTVTDTRQNVAYESAKDSLIGSILTNDRATSSVLADNSGERYFYYSTGDEAKDILNKQLEDAERIAKNSNAEFLRDEFIKDLERRMILVQKDQTGVYQPVLSEDQREDARKIVSDQIEIQTGRKEKGTAKKGMSYYGSRSGGGSGSRSDGEDYATYATIREAWTSADPSILTNATRGQYMFERDGSTWTVKSGKKTKDKNDNLVNETIATGIDNARDLAPYFFGYGTGSKGVTEAYQSYDDQKKAFVNSPEEARKWNEEWDKLGTGKSMIGLDGVRYTKQ